MKTIEEQEIEELFITQKVTPKQFTQVVVVFQERVYWLVRRMVLIHDDANDITQEVFIKVWEKRNTFKGKSALYSWIYRIATNAALEHIRKSKNKRHLSINDEDSDWVKRLQSDVYFSGDEAQVRFQKALQTLPEKQRLVFQMKYFEEMKYEQISEVLDTSVGGLKASYHHATQKIKEYLKQYD